MNWDYFEVIKFLGLRELLIDVEQGKLKASIYHS